jgi:hypothetical protein
MCVPSNQLSIMYFTQFDIDSSFIKVPFFSWVQYKFSTHFLKGPVARFSSDKFDLVMLGLITLTLHFQ